MPRTFTFKGKIWRDPKDMGWFFVDLDDGLSQKIKDMPENNANKYGLIKAKASVGSTSWQTTLFPTKRGNYVMSIIKKVRQKEHIEDDANLDVKIEI